ncbi:MAG: hypothetical protein Q7S22_03790 [Candidatus Micrarchaeota archaeon]|nr:hypothetical protein [Candidatus Micrarchaeota archaeon]
MYSPEFDYHFNRFKLSYREFEAHPTSKVLFERAFLDLNALVRSGKLVTQSPYLIGILEQYVIRFERAPYIQDIPSFKNPELNSVLTECANYIARESLERPFQAFLDLLTFLRKNPDIFHLEKIAHQTKVSDKFISCRIDAILHHIRTYSGSPTLAVINAINQDASSIRYVSTISEHPTPERPMGVLCKEAVIEMEKRVKALRIKWINAFIEHLEDLLVKGHYSVIADTCHGFGSVASLRNDGVDVVFTNIGTEARKESHGKHNSISKFLANIKDYIKDYVSDMKDGRVRTLSAIAAMRSNASRGNESRRKERIVGSALVAYYAGRTHLGTALALKKRYGR